MRLSTKRILIVPKESCHSAQIYKWFHSGDYESFFGNMPEITATMAMNFNSDGLNFMIVNSLNPDEVFGMLSMNQIEERHRNLHFGLLIDKKFHGMKLSKESMKLMIYYIMNCMNFFKVIGRVDPENEISKKLTESFGFELEGVLKQEEYRNGEFHDVLRYRMTKGSFNKRYKAEIESSEKELSVG